MVTGEPDDVLVRNALDQWVVRTAQDGVVTRRIFESKLLAEKFAEVERFRLGLPGEPPVDEQT